MWTLALLVATLLPHHLLARSVSGRNIIHTTTADEVGSPLVDPFYLVPSNVSSYPPGHVVRSRPVLTTVAGSSVKSYQLFYRTTNQQDEATGTVATVWAPAIPAIPTKLFSYQIAEDSLSRICAPSWSWVNGSAPLAGNVQQQGFIVPWALSHGYYVVSADFEGFDSELLVGLVEGRGVLDGIRATANYFGFGNDSTGFEVGLFGYSGAAHATVWASSLAAGYAAELNIVGAAYGGTPIDLLATYNLVNGGPYTSVGASGFIGSAKAIPWVNDTLFPLLTPDGKKIWQELQAPTYCVLYNSTALAGKNFSTSFTKDIFDISSISKGISEQSLLSNRSPLHVPVPTFPRLEWHGLNDTVAPVSPEIEYVKQQCSKGANIRLGLFPGLNHLPNLYNGLPGALLFLQEAFEKKLDKGKCGSNTTWPKIGSEVAIQLLGEDTNAALASLYIESEKASI